MSEIDDRLLTVYGLTPGAFRHRRWIREAIAAGMSFAWALHHVYELERDSPPLTVGEPNPQANLPPDHPNDMLCRCPRIHLGPCDPRGAA